jgi:hypothetical protein
LNIAIAYAALPNPQPHLVAPVPAPEITVMEAIQLQEKVSEMLGYVFIWNLVYCNTFKDYLTVNIFIL